MKSVFQHTGRMFVMLLVLLLCACSSYGPEEKAAIRVCQSYLSDIRSGKMPTAPAQGDGVFASWIDVQDGSMPAEFAQEYRDTLFKSWHVINAYNSGNDTVVIMELDTLADGVLSREALKQGVLEPLAEKAQELLPEDAGSNFEQEKEALVASLQEYAYPILMEYLDAAARQKVELTFKVSNQDQTILSIQGQ